MTGLAPFESSIAERYHEETKYSEDGLRRDALRFGPPDPARRPSPFKQLDGPRILLPTEGLPIQRGSGSAPDVDHAPPGRMDLAKLSRLLWLTNGVTRIEHNEWGVQHYRASPSAGAMYPTEVYVAVRDVPGLPAGIYDYQLLDHSLARVNASDAMPALHGASFGHPAFAVSDAAVILAAEWFRSSWRYRERGARRVLLDTGHVLGNLVEVVPMEGFEAVPIASFRDEVVEKLLGVDAAFEAPLALVPLVDAAKAADVARLPNRRSETVEWHKALHDVGDRADESEPERIIIALELASRLAQNAAPAPPAPPSERDFGDAPTVDATARPTSWDDDESIGDTIAARRSTRTFRRTAIPSPALFRALAHAYPTPDTGLFAPELLETHLVAVDVAGLPSGSWFYERAPRRLVQRVLGDYGQTLHHLGLGQDIFVNAAAVLIHAVDLTRAVARYGDRAYRLALLDAGHVGERLNLAALREGFGASGCGGYFDDELNRVLKIPESRAVVYVTCLGVPGE